MSHHWMTRWVLGCVGLFGGLLLAGAANALEVRDDRGVTSRWTTPPQRIVTLLPSLTETVCDLGACERIVGVDRHSNHPASVHKLTKLGGLDDANVELIVAMRPDVVLLGVSSRVIDRLEALGLKVVALEPRTQDDVRRVVQKVGAVLGRVPESERLARRIDAEVDAAAAMVPKAARGWRVYYEVDSAPYAAGTSSFIGHTLQRLSLDNIVPASLGPFPRLNPEFVVRADPFLIMVGARSAPGLPQRPGWDRIRAVRDGRICVFSPSQVDVLSRPGPRMGEAARIMLGCLQQQVARQAGARP